MSIKRMSAVWELSQHSGSALLFLLALADYADDNGLSWPGQTSLAHKVRVERRNLSRIIDTVQESGEAWVVNRAKRQSNIYVVMPGLDVDALVSSVERAVSMGAETTRGSDVLMLPPQVLEVASKHPYLEPILLTGGVIGSLRSVIMTPGWHHGDARSVINHHYPSEKKDLSSLWTPILTHVAGTMTQAAFNQWLRGTQLLAADNGTWTVQVASDSAAEWLANRLAPVLDQALTACGHPGTTLQFVPVRATLCGRPPGGDNP